MSVVYEKNGHVAVVRLNRPEAMNSVDAAMREALRDAWTDVARDDAIRVAVLTGTGDRAFCAGTDLRAAAPAAGGFAEQMFSAGKRNVTDGMQMPKPLIAAINGHAIGGGLELALACDLRVASESATFALSEVKLGSLAGSGGTQRLIRAIPQAVAMKMLLTGERIDALEAHRVGLVSDMVPLQQLMQLALQIADRICHNAPLSVRAAKLAALRGRGMALDDGLVLEQAFFGLLRDTEDRTEGRRAFAEKRPPRYRGR